MKVLSQNKKRLKDLDDFVITFSESMQYRIDKQSAGIKAMADPQNRGMLRDEACRKGEEEYTEYAKKYKIPQYGYCISTVGVYSTEEKAISVINRMIKHSENNGKIFIMPQNDEVE